MFEKKDNDSSLSAFIPKAVNYEKRDSDSSLSTFVPKAGHYEKKGSDSSLSAFVPKAGNYEKRDNDSSLSAFVPNPIKYNGADSDKSRDTTLASFVPSPNTYQVDKDVHDISLAAPTNTSAKYKSTVINFSGIDKREHNDQNTLSATHNINPKAFPYVEPMRREAEYIKIPVVTGTNGTLNPTWSGSIEPTNIISAGNDLFVFSEGENYDCFAFVVKDDNDYTSDNPMLLHFECNATDSCAVEFRKMIYETGEYEKKVLLFPSKKYMQAHKCVFCLASGDYEYTPSMNNSTFRSNVLTTIFGVPNIASRDSSTLYVCFDGDYTFTSGGQGCLTPRFYIYMLEDGIHWSDDKEYYSNRDKMFVAPNFNFTSSGVTPPREFDYCVVHKQRVFGVKDGCVYASKFNEYNDFTTGENVDDGWMSTSQSNAKASGEFTGIATYQNHVVLFKKDFMHEVIGSNNPFSIQDVFSVGTVDHRSICEVGGYLIFCATDDVYIYTGATPKSIGMCLCLNDVEEAVGGSDGRVYYLSVRMKDESSNSVIAMFCYDTKTGYWTQLKDSAAEETFTGLSGIATTLGGTFTVKKGAGIVSGRKIHSVGTYPPMRFSITTSEAGKLLSNAQKNNFPKYNNVALSTSDNGAGNIVSVKVIWDTIETEDSAAVSISEFRLPTLNNETAQYTLKGHLILQGGSPITSYYLADGVSNSISLNVIFQEGLDSENYEILGTDHYVSNIPTITTEKNSLFKIEYLTMPVKNISSNAIQDELVFVDTNPIITSGLDNAGRNYVGTINQSRNNNAVYKYYGNENYREKTFKVIVGETSPITIQEESTCSNIVYKIGVGEYGAWSFDTQYFTNSTADIKHIQRIQVSMDLAAATQVSISALYDNDIDATEIYNYSSDTDETKTAIVTLTKSAHRMFKLRFCGNGWARIRSMEITFRDGGESNE